MKEHQAAGVTGCLKNIAYGDFSNVARSHEREISNTYSFIGTLASVEPLRSRTVLTSWTVYGAYGMEGRFCKAQDFFSFPSES
jgi:hypothetical protein